MSFEDFTAYFLAVFYSAVALFYVLLAKFRAKPQNGSHFIHMGQRYSLHWWNHLTFRIFRAMIWGVCVLRVFFPGVDAYLGMSAVFIAELALLGMILLVLGFGLAIAGNITLNGAWRSGIDRHGPERLVTSGLYAVSRNPMFIGVKMAQLGFVFALPSVFSLVCLIVGWVAVDIQIRLEEKHLSTQFPQTYPRYRQQVSRWLSLSRPRRGLAET